MATANLSDFFRRLTRGMAAHTLADRSDSQLVQSALARRDEVALQAIVERHGRMVYRVCWRILQHRQDAEDAFQATFLVLAQKLRTVRKHASLASWLHGVAHRVALKAKAQAAAGRCRERHASRPESLPPDDVTWGELRSVLDFELCQLPDKWRLPLILCYLEGRTQEESAGQLGWSKSTLRRRLEEARVAMGYRLKRRGLVWPAVLAALMVCDCTTFAAPASGVVAATVEAAAGLASGKPLAASVSAKIAALTEGVLKTMFIAKMRLATAVLSCTTLVTAGISGLCYTTRATEPTENRQELQPKSKPASPEDVQRLHLLAERARELEAAKKTLRQVEVILKNAQMKLAIAQEGYEKAQDSYVAERVRAQANEQTTLRGTLVKVNAKEDTIRLQHWKDVRGDGRQFIAMHFMAYEDFALAKDALILQDNVITKLGDLKPESRVTLHFNRERVARIIADGGTVPGPVRYVSSNEARKTIAVIAGRKDERRVYHLVKETETIAADGKTVNVSNLKEATLLLLTLSVQDSNTVVRIEAIPTEGRGKID
jgi:RNA polymerase sigma factor (sigma-70 family)